MEQNGEIRLKIEELYFLRWRLNDWSKLMVYSTRMWRRLRITAYVDTCAKTFIGLPTKCLSIYVCKSSPSDRFNRSFQFFFFFMFCSFSIINPTIFSAFAYTEQFYFYCYITNYITIKIIFIRGRFGWSEKEWLIYFRSSNI